MRIDSPIMTNAVMTGSFSGSFTGIIEQSSVITGALPAGVVSGSSQIDITATTGYTAFSSSIASDIAGLDGEYATDAELNASSSALTTAYRSELNASSSALISAYGSADTTLSSSLAADIASNLTSINSIGSFTASLDTDLTTLSLPANTTISSFGASLVDDADASAARTTLGVDAAGTDNSTDVTLVTTSHDYLSITGQAITLGTVDISDDTNLTAGTGVTLTGDTLSIGQAVGTGDSVTFASLTTTGNVTIQGDLSVLGDAVEIQVGSLSIEDKNILVASGAADSAAADGAGITIGGANESLTWNHANSRFNLSDDLNVDGNITLTGTVDGRDIASDGSKLDGIESSAKDDQTITAGTGLTGGGTGDVTISHADTSTQASVNNSGRTFIQDITLDDFGHVTAITSATDSDTYVGTVTSVATGTGLTGGTITSTGTISLSHLGFQTLTDPNADRIAFWDDSAGSFAWLSAGTNITISGTTISSTDTNTTYSAGTGVTLSGTTFSIGQAVATTSNVHFEGLMVGQTTGATANTIRCVGDIVAYYSSDAQFKDNVQTLEGSLDKVKAIRGVRFDWNDKQDVHTGHDIGVIAQEVEAVLPELVHEREYNNSKAVDYVKLTAVLIEAVKELAAKVEELEKK